MKKLVYMLPVLLVLAMALVSCGSAPPAEEPAAEEEAAMESAAVVEPVLIDHKNKALGGSAPDWVFQNVLDLEADSKFDGTYVFKPESMGKDLDGTIAMLSGMEVPTQVARQVSLRVQNKFVGAQVGDKDMLESYMENVTKSLAEAQITGLRQIDTYWLKFDEGGDLYFRVLQLYTVPKVEIQAAIDRALEGAGAQKPKTEEENKARARVQELFGDGMD